MSLERVEQAYRQHGRDLWRFLASLAGPEDADDLLQTLFLRLMDPRKERTADEIGRPLLFRMAYNLFVDGWRRRQAEQRSLEGKAIASPPHRSHAEDLSDRIRQIVDRTIEGMTERQGDLIRYRFFGRLNMTEIAEILEISRRTAHREYDACLSQLRRNLERAGISPDELP